MTNTPASSATEDLITVNCITLIPTLLKNICISTGLGFAAVARVTEKQWLHAQSEMKFSLASRSEMS